MTSGNSEIYVSTDNSNFYKLDLFKDESIKIKFLKKDTQDLTKIFASFSQGFSVPATPKNLQIFNQFGDSNLLRAYNSNKYFCKIYVRGVLNKVGELKIENVKYKNNRAISFNVAFNSKLVSLKDGISDDTFVDLITGQEEISFAPDSVYTSIQNTKTLNGITWYTPLISRYRVWSFDKQTAEDDNIAYFNSTNPTSNRLVRVDELRPAVSVLSLFRLIKDKYNLAINLPLENQTRFKNSFIWCNSDNFRPNSRKLILKQNYRQTNFNRAYKAVVDLTDSSIKITKGNNKTIGYNLTFTNVQLLDKKTAANATIRLIDKDTGELFHSENVVFQNGTTNINMRISKSGSFVKSIYTYIDIDTPIIWGNNSSLFYFITPSFLKGSYTSNNSSIETELYKVNLLRALPETKIIDFLRNIIKPFNISVFESSANNGVLDFLTPVDVDNTAEIYAKKEVDYTAYVVKEDFEKEVLDQYNYYNLKHNDGKYRSNNDYFNQFGIRYGQANFPSVKPENAKPFVIESGFTIIPPVSVNGNEDFITAYGFTSDTPTIESGLYRYTQNTEDLTLFYKSAPTSLLPIGCQNLNSSGALINSSLSQYLPTAPFDINTDISLSFSVLVYQNVSYYNTLYIAYFERMIQQLLDINSLEHTFELELPASEIVWALGTSIQPNGFRLQNDVIIQETKYDITEMELDITTGKAKVKLLNK